MRIAVASDHAGYDLKNTIIKHLESLGHDIFDLGCDDSKNAVDYPDISQKLCLKYLKDKLDFGILICGSGVGVSISANKIKNIRAALCYNEEIAKLSRNHNDSNILCLGSRMLDKDLALKTLESFINSKFLAGRHLVRINKIEN